MVLNDSGFLTVRNLSNIVLQTAPITIMAIGMVFVLSAGEIDLSIGSIVAVSALAAAVTMNDYGLMAGMLAGLGAGLLIGMLNGVLVAYVRLPSFLVTLATLGLFAGVARSLTNLRSIPVTDRTFTGFFGSGSLLGIPSLIWWTVIAIAVGHLDLPRDPLRRACAGDRRQSPCAQRVRHQRAAHPACRADDQRRSRRPCRPALRRPPAGRQVHARRDRPDDGDRGGHRRRHAAQRRQGLGRRRPGRLADDGHA